MTNSKTITFLALTAALTATACERRPPTEQPATGAPTAAAGTTADADPDALVLKTYKIPPGYATRLRPVLSTVMRHGDTTIGRVSFSPDGLVVVAPAGVHTGIQELVANLGSEPLAAPPTIEMSYWLVLGEPGKREADTGCGKLGLSCLDGGADGQLAQALKPAVEAQNIYVTQMHRMSMKTLESEDGRVSGPDAEVEQVASFSGDRIVANVRARVSGNGPGAQLDTRLQFKPNQTLVLGQVGYDPPTRQGSENNGGTNKIMFFVVRGAVHE